jgi:hypothetical protein
MPTPTFLSATTSNDSTENSAASIGLDPHVDTDAGNLLLLLWIGAMTDTGDDDTLTISTGWTAITQQTAQAGGRASNSTVGYWWRLADGGANDTATVTKGDHDRHGGMLVTVQGVAGLSYKRQDVTVDVVGDGNPYTVANPGVNANEYGFALLAAMESGGTLAGSLVSGSPWASAGTNTTRPANGNVVAEGGGAMSVLWVEGATSSTFDMDPGTTNLLRVSAVAVFGARLRNRRSLGLRR